MSSHPTSEELILNIAIDMIEERGIEGLRIQDVSREAGLAVTSIYHFFQSREGLVVAAQAERFIRSHRALTAEFLAQVAAAPTSDDLRRVILDRITFFFSPGRELERLRRLNILGSAVSRPELVTKMRDALTEVNDEAAKTITIAQEAGLVTRQVDPATTAMWISSLIQARSLIELIPLDIDYDEWSRLTITAVTSALGLTPDE
jgi:AcrR family transcriptional regulator